MKRIQHMSESELEIMKIVWAAKDGVTSSFLQRELSDTKGWKLNTIITFLSRLEEKGIMTALKRGKGRQSVYLAKITEQEYKSFETHSFLDIVHNGSVKNLIASLYDTEQKLSLDDLDELKDWFNEKTKTNQEN